VEAKRAGMTMAAVMGWTSLSWIGSWAD